MTAADPLRQHVQNQGVVILDGALATELERRGADLRDDLWSAKLLVDDPDSIRRLHFDYFRAGADVATSASYQASFEGFARRGFSRLEAASLLQRSVQLAQEARDRFWKQQQLSPAARGTRLRPLVAASIGSYGAFLADGSEYQGAYGLSKRALKEWHRPRLEALLAPEPDLLACETIPCLLEGEALVELLDEYGQVPAWLSFSCRDPERVCHGELFAECVGLADACSSVIAVGLNCTPPQYAASLLQHAQASTDKPLVCYPNSGETWDRATRCWVAGSGQGEFAAQAETWRGAGAQLIGGCCRTSPLDIQNLRTCLLSTPIHE